MKRSIEITLSIKRIFMFLVIAILFFAGCLGNETKNDFEQSSRETSTYDGAAVSEVIVRTLQDQIADWTEGQFYPGAYQKESDDFILPQGPNRFVLEEEGVLYAYGNMSENGGSEHRIMVFQGANQKEISLSEIPGDFKVFGVSVAKGALYLLTIPIDAISEPNRSYTELFIYTTEGILKSRKNLTELLDSEKIVDTSVSAFTDLAGRFWIRIPEEGKLYCVQPNGMVSDIITIPTDFLGGFMRGREPDELIAVLGTGTGLIFGKMNTKAGTSENYTIESFLGVQRVFAGNKYDAIVVTEKSLYGVSLGDTIYIEELFAFMDLGIDETVLHSIEDHEDGSFSAILIERARTEGERLSLIPKTKEVREGLVLACIENNDYIRYAVNLYNLKNPDNIITVKEYYDKYAIDVSKEDAINRLNSDIIDGTAGDIICLDGLKSSGEAISYLKKDLFLDLYELMDADPEFHKEDYFTDIFRINETDGNLCRLVPFFSLNTKYGRVDETGKTTHMDESLLFETKPVNSIYGPMYNRKQFIHDLLVFSLGDVQDRQSPLYNLDQMARYVEVAGEFPSFEFVDYRDGGPSEGEIEASSRQGPNDYRDGIIHFYTYTPALSYGEGTFFSLMRISSALFGEPGLPYHENMALDEAFRRHYSFDVQTTFCGFPVKEGCGSAIINSFTLMISAECKAREEAWEFLKCTLSEEYQSIRKLSFGTFPANRKVFMLNVEKLMEYTQDFDPHFLQRAGGGTSPHDSYWIPVTQQWMIDEFLELLADITIVDEVDPYVETIVTEEIAKYCDGRQTAEEAAKNIAERVELYADER